MMVTSQGVSGLYISIFLCSSKKWLMKGIDTLDKPAKQSTTVLFVNDAKAQFGQDGAEMDESNKDCL
jgi:hypothetical protein